MLYILLVILIFLCLLFQIPVLFPLENQVGGELIFTHILLLLILLLLIRIYYLLKECLVYKTSKEQIDTKKED